MSGPDSGFLEQLTPNGFLDRFAWLDKSGERRIHPGREMPAPSDKAAIAKGCQHDDNRIGTRKMFGTAVWAEPPITCIHQCGARSAARAKAMTLMPIDERLRLTEDREIAVGVESGGGAQLTKVPQTGQRSCRFRVRRRGNVECENCAFAFPSEKHARRILSRDDFAQTGREERGPQRFLALSDRERLQSPHRMDERVRIPALRRNPVCVGSQVTGAIEAVAGKGNHGRHICT